MRAAAVSAGVTCGLLGLLVGVWIGQAGTGPATQADPVRVYAPGPATEALPLAPVLTADAAGRALTQALQRESPGTTYIVMMLHEGEDLPRAHWRAEGGDSHHSTSRR